MKHFTHVDRTRYVEQLSILIEIQKILLRFFTCEIGISEVQCLKQDQINLNFITLLTRIATINHRLHGVSREQNYRTNTKCTYTIVQTVNKRTCYENRNPVPTPCNYDSSFRIPLLQGHGGKRVVRTLTLTYAVSRFKRHMYFHLWVKLKLCIKYRLSRSIIELWSNLLRGYFAG